MRTSTSDRDLSDLADLRPHEKAPGKMASTSRLAPRPQGVTGGLPTAAPVQRKASAAPAADHPIWGLVTGAGGDYDRADEIIASAGRAVQLDTGGSGDPARVQAAAQAGVVGGGGTLPHLDTIQRAFGHHDVAGVRAHIGGAAAEASAAIGARAYATGDDVAFAASPDLHTAAHEAAHVVQQRGGVRLAGGVGREGDPYERHADAVADLVVRGESAEAVLDTMAHRGAAGGSAVQCIVDPATDRRLADQEARRQATLAGMDTAALTALARELDADVVGGAHELGSLTRAARARTLCRIYDLVETRNQEHLIGPAGADDPLGGLIETTVPFGNVDQWHALANIPRRARRTPRPHRPPPPGDHGHDSTTAPSPSLTGGVPVHTGDALATEGHLDTSTPETSMGEELGSGVAEHVAGELIEHLVLHGIIEDAGMLLTPILMGAHFIEAAEASREQAERGARAWGVRMAVYSLDTQQRPFPAHYAVGTVVGLTQSYCPQEWRSLTEYQFTDGGAGSLLGATRGGIADATRTVNTSFDQGDASIAQRASALHATPAQVTDAQQQMREAVIRALAARFRTAS